MVFGDCFTPHATHVCCLHTPSRCVHSATPPSTPALNSPIFECWTEPQSATVYSTNHILALGKQLKDPLRSPLPPFSFFFDRVWRKGGLAKGGAGARFSLQSPSQPACRPATSLQQHRVLNVFGLRGRTLKQK